MDGGLEEPTERRRKSPSTGPGRKRWRMEGPCLPDLLCLPGPPPPPLPQMNISPQHMNIASVTSACKHTKAECSNPLSGSY